MVPPAKEEAPETQFTQSSHRSISLLDRGERCITSWRGTVLLQVMFFLFVCTCRLPDSPLLPWQVPLGTPVFLYLDCRSYIPLASIKSHIYVCVCLCIRDEARWQQLGKGTGQLASSLSLTLLAAAARPTYFPKSLRSEECSIFKNSGWKRPIFICTFSENWLQLSQGRGGTQGTLTRARKVLDSK